MLTCSSEGTELSVFLIIAYRHKGHAEPDKVFHVPYLMWVQVIDISVIDISTGDGGGHPVREA